MCVNGVILLSCECLWIPPPPPPQYHLHLKALVTRIVRPAVLSLIRPVYTYTFFLANGASLYAGKTFWKIELIHWWYMYLYTEILQNIWALRDQFKLWKYVCNGTRNKEQRQRTFLLNNIYLYFFHICALHALSKT